MKPIQDIYAPWEKTFKTVVGPFERFVHYESAGGLMLIAATLLALVFANTAMYATYHHAFEAPVGINIGGWHLEHSVHHWINEALMCLFFFVVGLEIKREVLVGELSDPKKALLPIIAAIGGMIVPALIYASLNFGTPGASGWGAPMATDIAFAVGVLVLLGNRVPKTLFTFLVALAIVDDLGAVMVIAIFYTDQIVWDALEAAALLFGLLIFFNQFGIRNPLPYFVVGTFLWMAMLESGVHATLAGVLTALTIPARPRYEPKRFVQLMRNLMDRFEQNYTAAPQLIGNVQQTALLRTLEEGVQQVETPLERLEHHLHLPVSFLIIPLFALANAGIPIHFNELATTLSHPITVGMMLGLIVGKFVGISVLSLLAIRLGIAQFPDQTDTRHIIGVGLLGGIGFTMSIFVSELGFVGMPQELIMGKTGILFASLIAGLTGYLWLRWASKKDEARAQQPRARDSLEQAEGVMEPLLLASKKDEPRAQQPRSHDSLEQAEEVMEDSDQSTQAVNLVTSELAALQNDVRLESRQFKSALDQFRELFSSLEDHTHKLETELERCNDVKEEIRANSERELLLNIIEVRDRITASIRSMDQNRPDLLARDSGRNEQFLHLKSMAEGQQITLRRLDDLLTRYQVEPIHAMGAMVDPHTMRVHAVEHHPERENGEVIAEITKGFRRNNDILQTAEVIVNKTEAAS